MKPIDLAVVIPTVNRSPKPNYIQQTLSSLAKSVSDVSTDNVHLFILDDCVSENKSSFNRSCLYPPSDYPIKWLSFGTREHLPAYLKIAECLKIGHKYASKWVLLLEDDVLVCRDFFGSVLRWLETSRGGYSCKIYDNISRLENDLAKIISFGSAHPDIKLGLEANFDGIRIPAHEFYGTQAIAMRPDTALAIARYLETSPRCKERPGEYDLTIADWIRENQPDYPYVVASVPSFVQHIGRESSIRENGVFFEFDSFPGEDWTYEVRL